MTSLPPSPHARRQRGQSSASLIAGVAAMITALGGTVGVLYQTGVLGHRAATPATVPSTGASPSPSGSAGASPSDSPGSSASPSPEGSPSPEATSTPTPTWTYTPGPTPAPTDGHGVILR